MINCKPYTYQQGISATRDALINHVVRQLRSARFEFVECLQAAAAVSITLTWSSS